jgi:mannosyltransferase OCH1-like enzyme
MRGGIPKLLMQTWKTENIPKSWLSGQESMIRSLPDDWTYVFLTDSAMFQFVEFAFPELIRAFKALPYGVQRADILRYLWLYAYGGIYIDLDYFARKPFVHFFENITEPICTLYSANMPFIYTNSLIVARPGLSLLLDLARESLQRPRGPYWAITKHIEIMTSTGPLAFHAKLTQSKIPYVILPNALFLPDSPVLESKTVDDKSYTFALVGGSWNSFDSIVFNHMNSFKWTIIAFIILFVFYRIFENALTSFLLHSLVESISKGRREIKPATLRRMNEIIAHI